MESTRQEGQRISEIAARHGFGLEAAQTMLAALRQGQGVQAQFHHPEFGGMGQWSGGMLMIGDMFNTGLKARVAALIGDLAGLAADAGPEDRPSPAAGSDWPAGLGTPSASGSQNGTRYAVFPESRRLAVIQDGRTVVYDTGDHQIGGVSQQQGTGQSLRFSSQDGPVSVESLKQVDGAAPATGTPDANDGAVAAPGDGDTSVAATIERLHGLLSRGILTQAEFDAKKTELLGRL